MKSRPEAHPPSLRLRLLAGTILWIIITLLAAAWGLTRLFEQHVTGRLDAELTLHLDQLTAQLQLNQDTHPVLRSNPTDPRFDKPFSGLYWQIDIIDPTGKPLQRGILVSRSLWDELLIVPQDFPASGMIHRHQIHGPKAARLRVAERSLHLETRDLRLLVAADEQLMLQPLHEFQGSLWLALTLLGTGLLLAAALQVLMGLAPLKRLQAALTLVRQGKTRQIEGNFPTEIRPLVDEFNRVLTQNAMMIDRARTQAGNLAHALKTPLAILSNAAQMPDREDDTLARQVLLELARVKQHVDYHLSRAQAAGRARSPEARVAVTPVIESLFRVMTRVHAERRLDFVFRPPRPELHFAGDQEDFEEMLGNLLDNAAKWAKQTVVVSVHSHENGLRMLIDDDGHGIDAATRHAVLQRGVRADQHVPGSGLGLAIVDDLVTLYRGTLELAPSPHGGLRVEIILPAAGNSRSDVTA